MTDLDDLVRNLAQHQDEMTESQQTAHLVAVLTVLNAGLPSVVDDLLAGHATPVHLAKLAALFEKIARQLRQASMDDHG